MLRNGVPNGAVEQEESYAASSKPIDWIPGARARTCARFPGQGPGSKRNPRGYRAGPPEGDAADSRF
jgi:hypothetical protein